MTSFFFLFPRKRSSSSPCTAHWAEHYLFTAGLRACGWRCVARGDVDVGQRPARYCPEAHVTSQGTEEKKIVKQEDKARKRLAGKGGGMQRHVSGGLGSEGGERQVREREGGKWGTVSASRVQGKEGGPNQKRTHVHASTHTHAQTPRSNRRQKKGRRQPSRLFAFPLRPLAEELPAWSFSIQRRCRRSRGGGEALLIGLWCMTGGAGEPLPHPPHPALRALPAPQWVGGKRRRAVTSVGSAWRHITHKAQRHPLPLPGASPMLDKRKKGKLRRKTRRTPDA